LDPKPIVGVSEYSAFGNNPILLGDPYGDTIRIRSIAEVMKRTLSDKGGTASYLGESIEYKDANLVPAKNKDGVLVGYHVFDTKSNNKNHVLEIEAKDLADFKAGYDSYIGGARAFYSLGEPDISVTKVVAGVFEKNGALYWEGIVNLNKEAWSDPSYITGLASGTIVARGTNNSKLPNSGPILRSLGAASKAEMMAKKFKMNINSPTARQVLNSLEVTVESFISQYRKASIRSEMPGEFLNQTIEDALKSGNSTVRKLLTDGRFVK
jgi:hypothetical protein